jgi:predicted DNA repair protein MutK
MMREGGVRGKPGAMYACGNIRTPSTRASQVPASSLLALIDDIASILDDVSVLTKVATKKTAGVLGDDLALNAQQVSGVHAERELPVVWAVAKGSMVNKAILVPAALLISAVTPWAVIPLLMVGGLFLCYEGFEKLAHKFLHPPEEDEAHRQALTQALVDPNRDLVQLEKDKIKGAVRTDFILSAEIIVIALGTVAAVPLGTRIAVLVGIAIIMTVGVYGLVAGIVKLDDLGLYLMRKEGGGWARWQRALGAGILRLAPYMMKFLSVAGTVAMFLVGGGILTHGIPFLHHWIEHVSGLAAAIPGAGVVLRWLAPLLLNVLAGILAGALVVGIVAVVRRLWPGGRAAAEGH